MENASWKNSTEDNNLINSSLFWKTMGTVPWTQHNTLTITTSQDTWTIVLVPQRPWVTLRASYQHPRAFPLQHWIPVVTPAYFSILLIACLSWHCHSQLSLTHQLDRHPVHHPSVAVHYRAHLLLFHPLSRGESTHSTTIPTSPLETPPHRASLESWENSVPVLLHLNSSQLLLGASPLLKRFQDL